MARKIETSSFPPSTGKLVFGTEGWRSVAQITADQRAPAGARSNVHQLACQCPKSFPTRRMGAVDYRTPT